MASLTPFLWFDADLAGPLAFYQSVFPHLVVGESSGAGGGPVFSATIELLGERLRLFHAGPPPAGFTESFSMFVQVATQTEIDGLWDRLTADGGEPGQCGWLKDRYGLSWQIVPEMLGSVLGGPDPRRSQRAQDAMLKMQKLDIAALQAAYDQ